VAVLIELGPCINCGLCRRTCPTDAIHFFTTHRRTHVVESALCIDCDRCVKVCPENCIVPDTAYVHDADQLGAAKEKARAWAGRQNAMRKRLRERALAAALTARKLAAGVGHA
jgi:formate hydrogenlyase subunit 6/NADH:ubiquinone oxidoreductase subunit I